MLYSTSFSHIDKKKSINLLALYYFLLLNGEFCDYTRNDIIKFCHHPNVTLEIILIQLKMLLYF